MRQRRREGRIVFSTWGLLACLVAGLHAGAAAAPSGSRPSLDAFLGERGYVKAEVKAGQANHLLTIGKVNGKKMVCMLDTGCEGDLIDSERAPRLRSLPTQTVKVYGLLGKVGDEQRMGEIERFQLGGIFATNVPAAVLRLNRDLGPDSWVERIDFILGLESLRKFNALINYRTPCLYLRPEPPGEKLAEVIKKSLVATGFSAVPLHRYGGKVFVDGLVNDKPARFVLDTGGSATLLDQAQVAAYDLDEREDVGQIKDLSAARGDLRFAKPSALRFGGFELKRLPVGVARLLAIEKMNAELKKEGERELLGFLGPELLGRGSAIIDCAGDTLYLLPPKE